MTVRSLKSTKRRQEAWQKALDAAVRPEFNVDVYVARPGDRVLYGTACAVPSCGAPSRAIGGLCSGHGLLWKRTGGTDRDTWAATDPQLPVRDRVIEECPVHGCDRSRHGRFCQTHNARWVSHGRPDPEEWARTTGEATSATGAVPVACYMPGCAFPTKPGVEASTLCDSHYMRYYQWKRNHPGASEADFAYSVEVRALPKFWFIPRQGQISPVVQREIQYAVQTRHDESTTTWRADMHVGLIDTLARLGIDSILDLAPLLEATDARVTPAAKAANVKLSAMVPNGNQRGFLRYTLDVLQTLELRVNGLNEYDRDVWRLRELGMFEAHQYEATPNLDFRPLRPYPWMHRLAKRWIKWRISTGAKPSTLNDCVRGLVTFASYLDDEGEPLASPADLDRDLLIDYHRWERESGKADATIKRELSALNTFLHQVRLNEWEPRLKWNAAYFRGEYGKGVATLPRFLHPDVLAQLQAESALALLPNDVVRTMIRVVLETGLRISDLRRLPLDCVYLDGERDPNLRPFNWKMSREFAIPISHALHAYIKVQQERVRGQYPDSPWLFPRDLRNPDGNHPYTYGAFKQQLTAWIESLDLRDENGKSIKVSGHLFRHSVATLMLNNGMSLTAVQTYLDHDRLETTMIYAKVIDTTLRKEWQDAQDAIRVNINGEILPPMTDGIESNSRWLKDEMARANQAVAHGWCGRAPQSPCPHANACFDCDDFSSGPVFLGGIKSVRDRAIQTAEQAEQDGRVRVAEMNRKVAGNMTNVITAIERAVEETRAHEG